MTATVVECPTCGAPVEWGLRAQVGRFALSAANSSILGLGLRRSTPFPEAIWRMSCFPVICRPASIDSQFPHLSSFQGACR